MSDPVELKRELGDLLVERKRLNDAWKVWVKQMDDCVDPEVYLTQRAANIDHTRQLIRIGVRMNKIVDILLENQPKTAGESEQGTGINMPKRVCMSNPEDLKRELSDLLVERKNLRHARNTWLCAKEQCVDGELYVTEQAQYQVDTTRMSVIDARINEICGQAT